MAVGLARLASAACIAAVMALFTTGCSPTHQASGSRSPSRAAATATAGVTSASSTDACSLVSSTELASTIGMVSVTPAPVTPSLTTLANGARAKDCQVSLDGGNVTLIVVALTYPRPEIAAAQYESLTTLQSAATAIALPRVVARQAGTRSYRPPWRGASAFYLEGNRELYVGATVRDGESSRLDVAAFIELASTAARHWR